MTINTVKKDQLLWSNQPGMEKVDTTKELKAVVNGDISLVFEPVAYTYSKKDGSVVRAMKVSNASTGRDQWGKLAYGTPVEIVEVKKAE